MDGESKTTTLSQKTLVPVSAIFVIVGMFAGGAIWVGTVSNRIAQVEANLSSISTQVNELKQNNYTTNDRMARIETKLDILIEQLKK